MAKQNNDLSGFGFSEANFKITPDFDEIKKFDNEPVVNEKRFRMCFESLMSRDEYKLFIAFLNQNKLVADHNLYFFWIDLFESYEFYTSAKDIEYFKIARIFNKDLKLLKEKFPLIAASYRAYPEPKEKYFFDSLTLNLNTSKNEKETIKITAHPLIFDIFFQLNDYIENKSYKKANPVKNKLTYFKKFIYGTIPFFNYLKAKHFESKNDTNIYEFISGFLETLGIDWRKDLEIGDLPELYIKARYNEFKRLNKPPAE